MLCFETSKWAQTLWRSHLTHSRPARQVVAAGKKRQAAFEGVADDLHGLLYLRGHPQEIPDAPPWATDLLAQAQELAEWKPLKARCVASGFQAGLATEVLLRALVDLVSQGQDPETTQKRYEAMTLPGGSGGSAQAGETRRALRQALREAGKEVDAAEAMLEGVMGGGGSGEPLAKASSGSLVALEQVRALYALLGQNRVMQQMAQMAGRLQRMIASHKKAQAIGQVGAVTGIELGRDLARILPSELAGLRGGRLARLQVLATIQGRKALQYEVKGETPETRGPVIVLLDKSGSLSGAQVAWEAAFALTLLNVCQAQRRTWAIINFDHTLHAELVLEPGSGVTPEVCQALCHHPGGDTDFNKPLARALELLTQDTRLGKADLFFVTDGRPSTGCEPTAATLAGLQALRDTEGLSIFGLGIGAGARLSTIREVASETFHLSAHPDEDNTLMVPVLAQIA